MSTPADIVVDDQPIGLGFFAPSSLDGLTRWTLDATYATELDAGRNA
jgi:hypothetical protein